MMYVRIKVCFLLTFSKPWFSLLSNESKGAAGVARPECPSGCPCPQQCPHWMPVMLCKSGENIETFCVPFHFWQPGVLRSPELEMGALSCTIMRDNNLHSPDELCHECLNYS